MPNSGRNLPLSGRDLIIAALGPRRPDEITTEAYLRRGEKETGIGFPSLQKGWKNQYMSKITDFKLKLLAANNADNIALKVETLAADAEMAGRPRRDVDVLRAAARALRNMDVPTAPSEVEE